MHMYCHSNPFDAEEQAQIYLLARSALQSQWGLHEEAMYMGVSDGDLEHLRSKLEEYIQRGDYDVSSRRL